MSKLAKVPLVPQQVNLQKRIPYDYKNFTHAKKKKIQK